ncbi:MAG TPA: ABC transporter permease [Gemmataceae bacterium]|jgi:ABC-type multidrug transport system permease subunit|nr:ABC transporter permease [Gemmataceae bacterium]
MKRWQPFVQLLLARLREFYREPEVIFWVYGFPVLLAVGLGIAFSSREPEPPGVDVQESPQFAAETKELLKLLKTDGLTAELHDAETCRRRNQIGKTALYIVPTAAGFDYVYDPTLPESAVARARVNAVIERWKAEIHVTQVPDTTTRRWQVDSRSWETTDQLRREPGNRYIDFLLPGLMGMNLMGGGLWGVGFVIVDMRVRKLLKRLLATPMRRPDFLASILTGRMVFMLPEIVLLLLVGRLAFGVPIKGDWFTLVLTVFIGAAAFSGIGLLVACRTSKTETVSGLMNAVMLPMWLLSGIFFSSTHFPDVMQPFIQALPLTQLNNALREIMLEGSSLLGVWWRLAILAAWGGVSFYLALRWFRWQ